MRSLTSVSLPSYNEKTDAVLLYSSTDVTVLSADKMRTHVREVYKILRPEGRSYGNVYVYFHTPDQKVTNLHAWCVPAQGKDFEVKDKDATELAPPGVEGGELVQSVRAKSLQIPAPDPGNIVGYEYEIEERPLVLQDIWSFQETIPIHESHYSLQLPPGWEFKTSWLNHAEVTPLQSGNNHWEWIVNDVKEIRREPEMPPLNGVEGQMVVSFFTAGGPSPQNGYADWRGMGNWYASLVGNRAEPNDAIKQQVETLTASKPTPLAKMQAIAEFVQHDIRYVAIELGIGGWQPHSASDVFAHRYGDCKDKATLMRAMLREINIDSYHVVINTRRGGVTKDSPAYHGFNHAIIAIRLPEGLDDPSLIATLQHPKLGTILFFDPTNPITPFGQISGHLQANYGLLVAPDGGELVMLPQQKSTTNSIQRTAKLTLDSSGGLKGEVQETRVGDRASEERWWLQTVTVEKDRVKPIENLLAGSLTNFRLTHARIDNLRHTDQPFGLDYSFESSSYAKNAGGLLLVRPRVIGVKASDFLETKEPRRFPIEFDGPALDTDTFEITIPDGYAVDDMPGPVDLDYGFASYHSKTEVEGSVIRYKRTFEIKELSVPVSRSEDLRKFYRTIAGDERSTVVLKASGK
jgi:Domain of Unknown Function with PDB structure (DUF3857)/Transglutaminase-like superfamily